MMKRHTDSLTNNTNYIALITLKCKVRGGTSKLIWRNHKCVVIGAWGSREIMMEMQFQTIIF